MFEANITSELFLPPRKKDFASFLLLLAGLRTITADLFLLSLMRFFSTSSSYSLLMKRPSNSSFSSLNLISSSTTFEVSCSQPEVEAVIAVAGALESTETGSLLSKGVSEIVGSKNRKSRVYTKAYLNSNSPGLQRSSTVENRTTSHQD